MRIGLIMDELVNSDEYITVDYLAKKYNVSKRTIQNDLSYLIQMSSRHGFQLYMRRGRGYLLEVTNLDLMNCFIKFLKSNKNLEAKDRIKNIVVLLILESDFVSTQEVADKLQISKSSIKNDLSKIERLLNSYKLQLERKRYYGMRVIGKSEYAKKLLYDFYFDDNIYLQNLMKEITSEFTQVNSLLMKQIEKENLSINYNELKNVILWLEVETLYHKRHMSGIYYMEPSNETSIKRISNKLKEILEANFNIFIDSDSLRSIEKILELNIRPKKHPIVFSNQLKKDVDEFLEEVDRTYNTTFQEDQEFKTSLFMHVSLLLDRLYQKISYKNTLIKEICIRYPMIFNIAILFTDMLKAKYDVEVTQDEAGFIATHFMAHIEKERELKFNRFNKIAVICSSGGGSAYLLKLQIESLFNKAEVESFSFLEMEEVAKYNPNLIFTIMPLSREFSAPVIYIKEMLDDLDLVRIRQVLHYDNCDSISLKDVRKYNYEIFDRNFFKVTNKTDYIKIITEMAKEIQDSGYGDENYVDKVLDREKYMSTVYMNGIAVPHPIELLANKNLLSICILKNPIIHLGKEVKIIFMLCLTKDDFEIQKDITKKLYLLMKDEFRLQYILQNKTFDELVLILKELEG
ncbi:transcriptional antiterminator, BglG family [Granulicatella balaenopterae]|uniref:Transcriptional antiterminator, BglG family n=1 Tax=Granulicatella balaenopterae TaxID=137733 RepID=A0A1H9N5I6_9LACT|nr:PTS sugar transporter subunit IIA [Granulicatella balaenopterae]SER31246.1 transcriptional antiterminator, BglG family [Granulicatella balaenopterae]